MTAFYNKPDGSSIAESPALKKSFILPLGRLHKPVISYPITNTTWHNNKFRVLFESPIDDDYDTYDTTIKNNYQYKDIEVNINGTVYSFLNNPNIFSTTNLAYKVKECINPSLSTNLTSSTTYRISIRYQKNYYQTVWSEWSDTIVLNISTISNLNLVQDNLIMKDEFNTMRNYSYRLWQCYPIKTLPSDNQTVNKGDIIYKKRHQAIYDTILRYTKWSK